MRFERAPSNAARRERLPGIDLLRGLAILAVMHHHLFGFMLPDGFWRAPSLAGYPIPLWAPLAQGYYGVNVFFVLSGFVLFLPYVRDREWTFRWDEIGRFYRARARRLLPLYYLMLPIAFVLHHGWSWPVPGAWRELWLVGSFTSQFTTRYFLPSFNPALWSLAVEVSFSLLLPWIALAVLRSGMAVSLAVALAIAVGARWHGTGAYQLSWTDGLAGRIDDFVVGMAAAYVFVHRSPARRPWVWIVGGLATIQLACMAAAFWAVGDHRYARAVLVPDLISAGAFMLLRGVLAPGRTRLVGGIVQVIGRMSYSLYLWHLIARNALFPGFGFYSGWRFVLYFILVFGFSAFTYRFIEFGHQRDWRKLFLVPEARWGLG